MYLELRGNPSDFSIKAQEDLKSHISSALNVKPADVSFVRSEPLPKDNFIVILQMPSEVTRNLCAEAIEKPEWMLCCHITAVRVEQNSRIVLQEQPTAPTDTAVCPSRSLVIGMVSKYCNLLVTILGLLQFHKGGQGAKYIGGGVI